MKRRSILILLVAMPFAAPVIADETTDNRHYSFGLTVSKPSIQPRVFVRRNSDDPSAVVCVIRDHPGRPLREPWGASIVMTPSDAAAVGEVLSNTEEIIKETSKDPNKVGKLKDIEAGTMLVRFTHSPMSINRPPNTDRPIHIMSTDKSLKKGSTVISPRQATAIAPLLIEAKKLAELVDRNFQPQEWK